MIPLGHIIQRHNISFHCYTDDTQLYLQVKPTNITNLFSLTNQTLDVIIQMMSAIFFKLNSNKTEILIIGPDYLHPSIQSSLGPLSIYVIVMVFSQGQITNALTDSKWQKQMIQYQNSCWVYVSSKHHRRYLMRVDVIFVISHLTQIHLEKKNNNIWCWLFEFANSCAQKQDD